ncbi:MAG: hypothetical protein ACI959_001840 [Limisphaerales bacterium]|jgi:hypothetical protein
MKNSKKIIGVVFNPTIAAIVVLSLIAAFAITSCAEKKPTGLAVTDYQAILQERDSVINDWMGSFSDIQVSLDELKEREEIIALNGDAELSLRGREAILSDIESLSLLLTDNKERIEELEHSLKKSGLQVSGFRKQINRLTANIAARQETIVGLEETILTKDQQITGLFSFVDTLNSQLAVKEEVLLDTETQLEETTDELVARVDDLHTGYILTGKSKDLKAQGLIDSKLLGSKNLSEEMSRESFTSVDIRELREIPLESGKAELVTFHPKGSYNLVANKAAKNTTLEIINPEEFWEVSKYLVVSLK